MRAKLTSAYDVVRICAFDGPVDADVRSVLGDGLAIVLGKHLTKREAMAKQSEALEQRPGRVVLRRHRESKFCDLCKPLQSLQSVLRGEPLS